MMWEKEFLKLTKEVRTPLNHFTKVSCKIPILIYSYSSNSYILYLYFVNL